MVDVGHVIAGKYRVDRVVGVGGMGMVVGATHIQLGQRVALKFMLGGAQASATATARFLREGKAAVKLRSEHVCRVFDVGTLDDGAHFIVMEMLEGRDFAQIIRQRAPLPVGSAVEYVVQALEGVADAHANEIIHRDLKPSNLFVTIDGAGSPLVKVLDFGIAKSALDDGVATNPGDLVGSPAYMAPEQMDGAGVDARTDIWAIGVILYQAVTGRLPFAGDTLPELRTRITTEPPIPLPPELPAAFAAVVMRCLESDPGARFGNVGELAAALAPFGAVDSQARATRVDRIVHRRNSPLGPTLTSGGAVSSVGRALTFSRPALIGIGAVVLLAAIVVAKTTIGSPKSAVAVARGGTLRIAYGAGTDGFDLYSTEQSRSRFAVQQVSETLLQVDALGEVRPWLVDHHELHRDTATLALHLRPDVWFHDHPCLPGGKARVATGEDVAYSIREDQKYGGLDLPIDNITASGNDVSVHLTTVTPFYEAQLSDVNLIPKELEGCEDPRNMKQPVGTGPFRFASTPHTVVLDLVRAPHYWRQGADGRALPYLDGMTIEPLVDVRDTVGRLARGDLDFAMPNPDDWPELVTFQGDHPALAPRYAQLDVAVATRTGHGNIKSFGLYVGSADGALRDVRIRRALALALDRPALIKTATLPLSGPSSRFLAPRMLGYDETLVPLGHDLEAARALVREAAPSHPIRIGTITQQPMAAEIAREAAQVGLEVVIVDVPRSHVTQALGELDAVLMTTHWAVYDNEPADILQNLVRTDPVPRFDTLQRALLETPDRADRAAIYRDIEKALIDELTMIPIGWGDVSRPDEVYLLARRVSGFYDPLTAFAPAGRLAETSLARE